MIRALIFISVLLSSTAYADDKPKRTPLVVPLYSLAHCQPPDTVSACLKEYCLAVGYRGVAVNGSFTGDPDGKFDKNGTVRWVRNLTCHD